MDSAAIDENVSIRLIGSPDDEGLVNRFFATVSEETRKILVGFEFTSEFAAKMYAESRKNADIRRYLVIMHPSGDGELPVMIGMVWFWEWTKKVPWFGIMLADAYQNYGYGKKMLEFAIAEAHNHDKGGILLTTDKTNVRAQKVYRRYGFQMIGDDPRGEYLMILNFQA